MPEYPSSSVPLYLNVQVVVPLYPLYLNGVLLVPHRTNVLLVNHMYNKINA